MLLTNKFYVTYDMERIDNDFDIFLVIKPKDLYKTNILDMAVSQFKARSVQYTFGHKALVLFDKNDISIERFKKVMTSDYPDVTVMKLDVLNEETCSKHFYYQNRLLLQLLVNSLRVPRIKDFTYNNLTGQLLYGHPKWVRRNSSTKEPYSMYFLEISFDAGMYLNLDVRSFSKSEYSKDGRYYLLDKKNGCFRRKLKEDNVQPEELFIKVSNTGKRNTVTYFDFSSIERFEECKLGIMLRFLLDVEKYLGIYVTLTPEERMGDTTYKETKKEKENLSGVDYALILDELGVNIIDVCKTQESEQILSRLVSEFYKFYGITPQIGNLKKDMYNIRLIHDEDYYKENDQPDPHEEDMHGFIVQHMTQERNLSLAVPIGIKENHAVKKIVTELILKGDIIKRQISIFNWEKLCSDKEWVFVMRNRMKPSNGETYGLIENSAGIRTLYRYSYVSVQISRDGKMVFKSFDDTGLPENTFEEKIRYAYDRFEMEQNRGKKTVEGLVFSDIDNIHAIIRTREKTMPKISAIADALKETNAKESVPVTVIKEALASFKDLYPEGKEYTEEILWALKDKSTITKNELRKLVNVKKKIGKKLNRFLHEQYGIWVAPELKSKDFSDTYMLENFVDIKYFEDDDTDGKGIRSFNYYAGPAKDNLNYSLNNACIIRQVQAQEELEFKDLLPLMAVDFVRVGLFTVLPFPFKYLREYMNIMM